jgi:hypothetical protein
MSDDLLARVTADIDARRAALRPLVAEYERLLTAAAALEDDAAASAPRVASAKRAAGGARSAGAATSAPKARRVGARPGRAVRGAAQQAILAALEHGSHTAAELSAVTAMNGASIRANLSRLVGTGAVARAKREGKAAYALVRSAGR